jgi:sugar lactone lactonase YvrE
VVGGGELYGFTPAGALAETIATPMEGPTKLAFGDGRIFLTSKAGDNGGRLTAAPCPVQGMPVPRFGGERALSAGTTG